MGRGWWWPGRHCLAKAMPQGPLRLLKQNFLGVVFGQASEHELPAAPWVRSFPLIPKCCPGKGATAPIGILVRSWLLLLALQLLWLAVFCWWPTPVMRAAGPHPTGTPLGDSYIGKWGLGSAPMWGGAGGGPGAIACQCV